MNPVLQAKDYREVVEARLRSGGDPSRRRGVNALAQALRCHATFVAKVLAGRADFSMEQALGFADYFALTEFESQYFVDLVQVARAADARSKRFFEKRLEAMRAARLELSERLGGRMRPSSEVQSEYYASWIPQYIHIACQTEGQHTVKTLALRMRLPVSVVEADTRRLLSGGILREEQGYLQSAVDFMHLPRGSHLAASLHQQWRLKVASDVSRQDDANTLHFSGLMSIDKETSEKIRELLTASISDMKPLVAAARSQEVFYLGIDFYQPE